MSRKNKPLPILENVTIEAVAAEGKSLFHRITGQGDQQKRLVVFVPFCVPGDVVDVRLTRKKHSFAEGEVVRLVKASELRCEAKCKHFGVCGGCKWQNMPYEEQLKFKQQQVYDQLTRIGKVELPEFSPIMGSVKQFEYRNKLDFGCSNKQWLTREQMQQGVPFEPGIGFHISGAFDKILPIEKCWLMDDLNNRVRNYIYRYARSSVNNEQLTVNSEAAQQGITFYDLRAQHGLLRDLVMRNSLSGEFMLVVQFGPKEPIANNKEAVAEEVRTMSQFDEENAMKILEAVHVEFPEITSLLWVYNPKCNDTFGDLEVHRYWGTEYIYELMEDLKFKVGPKSFYQTNTEQALHLYEVARKLALKAPSDSPKGEGKEITSEDNGILYDLYTGTGTIANFCARHFKKVVGIEYVPEAIEDAKVNSQINGIDNTEFFAGDMKDILTEEFVRKHGRPDTIITDPPRAGMHPDVINVILGAAPKRIVYVSCNPATQARDMQLMDGAYKVAAVQPVDMFPHTPHVENVVLLVKR